MAGVTSARVAMYDLLFDVFVGLSGDALLSEIKGGRFDGLLSTCTEAEEQKIREGARLIASFRSSAELDSVSNLEKEVVTDRNRLIRATDQEGFRPPYERLYVPNRSGDGPLLQALNRFYRKAGFSLDDASGESSDFLFVELDFMKQLCLREIEESLCGALADATRAVEREFLRQHLGKWAGAYCAEAQRHARTVFYRGFLAVLDGFIASETSYLNEQV